jgi:hypothetical protein
MDVDELLDEEYDLVHVRAGSWGAAPPKTASLVRLEFEFLGFALTLASARQRRRALDRHGVSVMVVPVRYRAGDLGDAEIARRGREALEAATAAHPEVRFEPPRLYGDHPMFSTFIAGSPQLEREGRFPPGLLAAVDRCDGHIWTEAELERYFIATGP